ncbi:hypothetical protein [Paraflavitalea sp. CAU 1676]|uniref:hypothetical protein n=1 Tax=Paraflavitalea sp. CAU 1676 TaxID=3032598 RepID=UPI0023DACC1B|nr:hypothetical protein [Paraflavitalea sp. CAU 1676]MDF2189317.1 hypothetical protein [Paraflavitalea sp. CAU 1676]
MPAKMEHKRAAHKYRKAVTGRKPGSKVVCQRGAEGATAAATIADSIHSVKLETKSGIYVFCNQSNATVEEDEVNDMCDEIWTIYRNMLAKIKKEKLSLDPLAAGLSPATALTMALRGLRALIPADFEFNIEHSKGVFFIVVYQFCDFQRMWHCLEVGPVLLKLAKCNKPLHDLYLSFIRTFSQSAGVGLWDSGELGYAAESMDDYLAEDDEKGRAEALECIHLYEKGYIHDYLQRIKRAPVMKPAELLKRARRYKAGNPIANLIYQGAQLLTRGHSVHEFTYIPAGEVDHPYLDLDLQLNVAWDLNDKVTAHCEYMLDGMAQEGTQDPVAALNIFTNTKDYDFDALRKKATWPDELSQFFSRAWELTETFKK